MPTWISILLYILHLILCCLCKKRIEFWFSVVSAKRESSCHTTYSNTFISSYWNGLGTWSTISIYSNLVRSEVLVCNQRFARMFCVWSQDLYSIQEQVLCLFEFQSCCTCSIWFSVVSARRESSFDSLQKEIRVPTQRIQLRESKSSIWYNRLNMVLYHTQSNVYYARNHFTHMHTLVRIQD